MVGEQNDKKHEEANTLGLNQRRSGQVVVTDEEYLKRLNVHGS